jgi:NTP pyrophosphatase (non-canonical NTP hydrolase)
MFAIGDKEWPGVSKLVEEIGEIGQVLGKLMGSRGDTKHWSGDLRDMMQTEIGDVLAAIAFVVDHNPVLNRDAITEQFDRKVALFKQWHADDPEHTMAAAAQGTCDGCSRYSANLWLVDERLLCGGCKRGFETKPK